MGGGGRLPAGAHPSARNNGDSLGFAAPGPLGLVLGVGLAAVWLAAGALAVLVFERGDVYWLPPSGLQIFLVVSLLCLGLSLALLLSPSSRAVFRRPVT